MGAGGEWGVISKAFLQQLEAAANRQRDEMIAAALVPVPGSATWWNRAFEPRRDPTERPQYTCSVSLTSRDFFEPIVPSDVFLRACIEAEGIGRVFPWSCEKGGNHAWSELQAVRRDGERALPRIRALRCKALR